MSQSSICASTPVRIGKSGRRIETLPVIVISTFLFVSIAGLAYLQLPQFGKAPSGQRLERIKQSPHYRDGSFQNVHYTPVISEGYTMLGEFYKTLIMSNPRLTPTSPIPSVKTNLLTLPRDRNVLVWFGHSSYLLQLDGKRFLVDPVFSGNASPVPASNRSFTGSDVYTAADMPDIDYLLISHDHYDHLDYQTVLALKPKVKRVLCGLGVGEHLEYWGYATEQIIEKDWDESFTLDEFTFHTTTARHGSGRALSFYNTLWLSFVIDAPSQKLFIGGDSGYDTHFAQIGQKYGPFDLAILENGQYNKAWHNIHMLPNEVIKAAIDLRAKRLLPVHSSKFVLGRHPWDEPLKQVTELAKNKPVALVTPMIGQLVDLNDRNQVFKPWWNGIN